uniref:Platelet endothelial cell adhesion molecule n=1 Tax=Fundulus heteroclitus TaxID=8078 RepID=A0A3Q2Q8A1_FUNHE
MGLLLLLTSTLLFSSFHSGTALNADLKITSVDLSVEPSDEVSRGTNVTLRCKGKVLTSRMDALIRVYTISKDDVVIYNKTTSSSEDFLYHLPEARVSNNGKYRCRMHMMGEEMGSQAVRLSVTGMSTPILQLSKAIVTEGEAVNATCLAPGETGSILFNFYDGSKDIDKMGQSSNPVMFRPKGVGDHVIRCSYSVFVMPDKFSSPQSNAVNLTVKELSVGPVLTISPQDNVYEGDALKITCSVNDSMKDYPDALLLLSQGDTLLNSGNTFVHANWIVQATGPELNVVCRLYVRSAEKVAMKTVSVTELFSVPILQMSPSEVFQGDSIRLTCTSRILSYDKLGGEPLIYRLESLTDNMTQANGIFVFKAKKIDFNYTCTVVAKGIKKKSNVLAINPKVPVSAPKISVHGSAILGKELNISCLSETGTPPITYTLWKNNKQDNTVVVQEFHKPAMFTVLVSEPEQLHEYFCRASNGNREPELSDKLRTAVIVPMTKAYLMVLPTSGDISEGHSVTLICSFTGTPPVTVGWYRESDSNSLNLTTTKINTTSYTFILSKKHSDKYYCKAQNRANFVESNRVELEVGMAKWKKLLISGTVILVVSSLVMMGCVLFIRSRRGRVQREPVSVWSSRKPETGSDDEISTASNDPEVEYTEVVHPRSEDPTRSPLRKGTDTVYSELQNSLQGEFTSIKPKTHYLPFIDMSQIIQFNSILFI